MTNIAENVGWLLFLALVMALSGALMKGLLKLVWDEGISGKVVDTTDALFAIGSAVWSWIQLLKSNWLATVCAVAVLLLVWGTTSASVYSSLGYAALVYAIAGVLVPTFLRRVKPVAQASTPATLQASQPEESSDS